MLYKNILLVDDDEDDHEIFLSAITEVNGGIICTGITDPILALQKLEARELNPEVIFLDLNMHVMSGQQFLVEIKKNPALSHIPVIIFSTTSHLPTIELTRELGAFDFITKPQKYDQLVEVLKVFLKT